MNWIEENSKKYRTYTVDEGVGGEVEAIPTSIVREKVGGLWQDYEDVRDKLMKWKRRYRQTADELAAAKADLQRTRMERDEYYDELHKGRAELAAAKASYDELSKLGNLNEVEEFIRKAAQVPQEEKVNVQQMVYAFYTLQTELAAAKAEVERLRGIEKSDIKQFAAMAMQGIISSIDSEGNYLRLKKHAEAKGMKVSEWIAEDAFKQAKALFNVLSEKQDL